MLARKGLLPDGFLLTRLAEDQNQPNRSRSRSQRARFITKTGSCNVAHKNIREQGRFLQDVFTTMVDLKWQHSLLIFTSAFLCSWMLFAMIWWLMAFAHGDLEPRDPEGEPGPVPCVTAIHSFTSAFLFSIEVQVRATVVNINLIHINQSLKMKQDSWWTGLVFSGCFRFVWFVTLKLLIHCHCVGLFSLRFSLQVIRRTVTAEGEVIPVCQLDIQVENPLRSNGIFLVSPLIISHTMERGSPLYELSAQSLASEDLEIIVVLEGVVETTGITMQARTSYTPEEILWGRRFVSIITEEDGRYCVDYSKFGNTVPVRMPSLSAKELDQTRGVQEGGSEVQPQGWGLVRAGRGGFRRGGRTCDSSAPQPWYAQSEKPAEREAEQKGQKKTVQLEVIGRQIEEDGLEDMSD
uniref:Potassium inwardly rectifying channel subfamily J member 11, like n=1 Tax=Seriola lalandi dorsalis TaxID=1841481 RepID=A0A3B4WQ27_SERLL